MDESEEVVSQARQLLADEGLVEVGEKELCLVDGGTSAYALQEAVRIKAGGGGEIDPGGNVMLLEAGIKLDPPRAARRAPALALRQ